MVEMWNWFKSNWFYVVLGVALALSFDRMMNEDLENMCRRHVIDSSKCPNGV